MVHGPRPVCNSPLKVLSLEFQLYHRFDRHLIAQGMQIYIAYTCMGIGYRQSTLVKFDDDRIGCLGLYEHAITRGCFG